MFKERLANPNVQIQLVQRGNGCYEKIIASQNYIILHYKLDCVDTPEDEDPA